MTTAGPPFDFAQGRLFGDDNQKGKGNSNYDGNGNYDDNGKGKGNDNSNSNYDGNGSGGAEGWMKISVGRRGGDGLQSGNA